jgi:hypothetical protein
MLRVLPGAQRGVLAAAGVRGAPRWLIVLGGVVLATLGRAAGRAGMERRVGRVLGVDRPRARAMLAAARARLGAPDYLARAGSFLVATSPAGRFLPVRARQLAIRSLVGKLLERPGDILFYLGELPEPPAGSCRGLVEA